MAKKKKEEGSQDFQVGNGFGTQGYHLTDHSSSSLSTKKDALPRILLLPPSSRSSLPLFPLPFPSLLLPSTSLSASLLSVSYHFEAAVFVSPGRAIRTRHFFFSGRWYHSRLDRAKHTSSCVSFFFFLSTTTTTTTTTTQRHRRGQHRFTTTRW